MVTFQSDVFHPLVTPLTTYTYSTRDAGADTQSAADEQRLPPGGLSLRHGFPAWFQVASTVRQEANQSEHVPQSQDPAAQQAQSSKPRRPPHVIQLLQYLCVAFDTEEVLDSIPLDAAANAGAWHAWQSYRAKSSSSRAASVAQSPSDEKGQGAERSLSPKQQPGGARKPGEWNWQGVWEDRVRKSIQASASEHVLYGGENNDVVRLDAVVLRRKIRTADFGHRSVSLRWMVKPPIRCRQPVSRKMRRQYLEKHCREHGRRPSWLRRYTRQVPNPHLDRFDSMNGKWQALTLHLPDRSV